MTDAPRPEARAPRGFNDRRARDLAAERQILADGCLINYYKNN